MSRHDDWMWHDASPKKAPPAHGIRMKKSGATWWGRRWVEALERLSRDYSSRLARGRSYARAGRTHDLVVRPGKVTAKVTGSRSTPYDVTLTLATFDAAVWDRAIAAMAAQAQFSAELLAGSMPQDIDTAFAKAGASLFPAKEADLVTGCTCPDWANPCKHVAATHYVLGEAFDRDPFLIFELRGRTKAQVLAALRVVRAGGKGVDPSGSDTQATLRRSPRSAGPDMPTVILRRLNVVGYDKLRKPLPTLRLTFELPPVSGALVRQLGAPSGWTGDAAPDELLGEAIRLAALRARDMAMAHAEPLDTFAPPRARVAGLVIAAAQQTHASATALDTPRPRCRRRP